PINTSHIGVKFEDPNLPSQFTGTWITVEDCGIPAMLAPFVKGALETLDPQAFAQQVLSFWPDLLKKELDLLLQKIRNLFPHTSDPKNFQTEAEMLSDIFYFNAMGTDNASGKFTMDGDDLDLQWPNDQPIWQNPVFAK